MSPARKMSGRRAHTVSVLLSDEEFARFSRYCEAKGFKKSTLVARLIREHLDANRFEPPRDPAIREE